MYPNFTKAINRVSQINRANLGAERTLGQQYIDSKLVGQYLRRLGLFLKSISLDTGKPLFFNASKAIGYDFKGIFSTLLSNDEGASFWRKYICSFYLEWALLIDLGEKAALEFKDIYEPMIVLFENGGGSGIGMHHGELIGGDGFGAYPVSGGITYYTKIEPKSLIYSELHDERYTEIENGENALSEYLDFGKTYKRCLRCGEGILINSSISWTDGKKHFTHNAFYNVRCARENCFELSIRKKNATDSDYKLIVKEL